MEITLSFCRCSFKVLKQIYKPSIRYYSSEKIVPLNESTVIGRIVLFMNNEYNKSVSKISDELKSPHKNEIFNVIDKLKHNQISHISDLKFEQIEELLRTLNYKNYTTTNQHFKRLMSVVDLECCSRLDYIDSSSVLRILNIVTQSLPNRITEYKFYSEALSHLMADIDYLSKEELLQTIFYIGLQKKTKSAQSMVKNCLRKFSKDDIKSLSVEELCIICNSTFRTSTKINNKDILDSVKETLNDKLYLLKDTALFIILVKTIRHNRYQDDDLLNTISHTIFFNQTYKYYPFPVLCHILAMYADCQFYDKELLKLFVDLALKQIKESKILPHKEAIIQQDIRVKDITRFLWILSTLGYKGLDHDLLENVIVSDIMKRLEEGYYRKEIEELINSILYIWILNYQPLNLIYYALTEENVNKIREIKSKTKTRLNLLLACIFFENKKLFKELNIKIENRQVLNTQQQLKLRPNLVKVLSVLKQLTGEMAVNKFDVTYEVPHLNICGITGYTKKIYKTVYIEVLDDYVCVKNKYNMPIGIMQLKLRILREMDEAIIIIPGDIVEELSQIELMDYLKSEIELLC